MPARLVALDDGSDISLDRAMVVVGRHPQCDARLDSLRVSRHHCCMTIDQGGVLIRDLGSTNGIRINGHRVEFGRLQEGDELAIAHIRFRLTSVATSEATIVDRSGYPHAPLGVRLMADSLNREIMVDSHDQGTAPEPSDSPFNSMDIPTPTAPVSEENGPHRNQVLPKVRQPNSQENAIADAVRGILPEGIADRCQIQVIVKMPEEAPVAEKLEVCLPDSSH